MQTDEANITYEKAGEISLPNGCHLYWKPNEAGGRTYYSDEIGNDSDLLPDGIFVWDTCLADESTLLMAITNEHRLLKLEQLIKAGNTKVKIIMD